MTDCNSNFSSDISHCQRKCTGMISISILFYSLRPSDTIWRHRSGSTLAQVKACCLPAPNHYLNLSSVRSSDIHVRAISQEIPQPTIIQISLKIIHLKFNSNLPRANELKSAGYYFFILFHMIQEISNFPSNNLKSISVSCQHNLVPLGNVLV